MAKLAGAYNYFREQQARMSGLSGVGEGAFTQTQSPAGNNGDQTMAVHVPPYMLDNFPGAISYAFGFRQLLANRAQPNVAALNDDNEDIYFPFGLDANGFPDLSAQPSIPVAHIESDGEDHTDYGDFYYLSSMLDQTHAYNQASAQSESGSYNSTLGSATISDQTSYVSLAPNFSGSTGYASEVTQGSMLLIGKPIPVPIGGYAKCGLMGDGCSQFVAGRLPFLNFKILDNGNYGFTVDGNQAYGSVPNCDFGIGYDQSYKQMGLSYAVDAANNRIIGKLYLDGVYKGTQYASNIGIYTGLPTIGNYGSGDSAGYVGDLMAAIFFNRVMTDAEFATMANYDLYA